MNNAAAAAPVLFTIHSNDYQFSLSHNAHDVCVCVASTTHRHFPKSFSFEFARLLGLAEHFSLFCRQQKNAHVSVRCETTANEKYFSDFSFVGMLPCWRMGFFFAVLVVESKLCHVSLSRLHELCVLGGEEEGLYHYQCISMNLRLFVLELRMLRDSGLCCHTNDAELLFIHSFVRMWEFSFEWVGGIGVLFVLCLCQRIGLKLIFELGETFLWNAKIHINRFHPMQKQTKYMIHSWVCDTHTHTHSLLAQNGRNIKSTSKSKQMPLGTRAAERERESES